jgi:hypothetical protein
VNDRSILSLPLDKAEFFWYNRATCLPGAGLGGFSCVSGKGKRMRPKKERLFAESLFVCD